MDGETRQMPGEVGGTLGKAASYSPTPHGGREEEDSSDSVFLKPTATTKGVGGISLATLSPSPIKRSAAGRSPPEASGGLHPAPRPDFHRASPGVKDWWSKPKLLLAALGLILLLILILVLPIALTLSARHSNISNATDANHSRALPLLDLGEQPTIVNVTNSSLGKTPAGETDAPDTILNDDELDSSLSQTEKKTETAAATEKEEGEADSPLPTPPVARCAGAFACREDNGTTVVGEQRVCDGVWDCPLGSDEDGCKVCHTGFSCDEGVLGELAGGGFRCLRGERLCDGVRDCLDGRDEEAYCGHNACRDGHHRCEGAAFQICIPPELLCDGEAHCPFDDDEANCEGSCQAGSFWCAANGRCLAPWMRCDGRPDCSDASDEEGCSCNACVGSDVILCSEPGRCLARELLCDGRADCPAAEDEMHCPGWCPPDEMAAVVLCEDGNEYPLRYACSGLLPHCDAACRSCDPELAFTCPNGTPRCIPRRLLCDGIAQCEGGDDEAEELCACRNDSFVCPPSAAAKARLAMGFSLAAPTKCLRPEQVCDGFWDCPEGAEERNCSACASPHPGLASVYCKQSSSCHPSAARCDGVVDCPDYSDEDACPCTLCKAQPWPTFFCQGRCLKADYICDPSSPFHCPGPAPADLAHCHPGFDPLNPPRLSSSP